MGSPQSTQRPQRSFWKLIDEAPQPRLELLDVEVDQQTDVTAGRLIHLFISAPSAVSAVNTSPHSGREH